MSATAEQQIDFLADRLTEVEGHMIDPKDFGRLESEVISLRRDLTTITQTLKDMTATLQDVQKTLDNAQGGWRTLILVGGAIGSMTAIIGTVTGHLKWTP